MSREPCSGIEPLVADRVEAVMPAEGIAPGRRECHDAQPGRCRVDFVYPGAIPNRIALEITGIWDGRHRAGVRFADGLTERLSEIAEREGLGGWLVAVQTGLDLRALEPEIAKVIRDAQPNRERMLATNDQIRPSHYTASDLARLPTRNAERRFMNEHERLKRMGLEEVKPIRAGREHVIAVLPITDVRSIGPFDDLLQQAVDDNAAKLGEAVGYERHLAVYVLRFDASTSPDLTAPPRFPPEIDVVWVVHRYRDETERHTVWVARRADPEWRVHPSAVEEP